MRIISGKYKGQRLTAFKADHIRPTTDRVKESQFNILFGRLEGAEVLDLFAGTGNLGLEALSRGARHVSFVEKHPKSLQLIKENIKKLGLAKEQYSIIATDVFAFLKQASGSGYDVIFIDPPFTEQLADQVMRQLSLCGDLLSPGGVISIESEKKEKLLERYGELVRMDQRHFGDKVLSFFSLAEDGTLNLHSKERKQ